MRTAVGVAVLLVAGGIVPVHSGSADAVTPAARAASPRPTALAPRHTQQRASRPAVAQLERRLAARRQRRAADAGGPTVTVAPVVGLRPGQSVTLTATGFAPNAQLIVIECANDVNGSPSCAFGTERFLATDDTGALTVPYTVSRHLRVAGLADLYDCAIVAAGCSIGWLDTGDYSHAGGVAIAFDPNASPASAITVVPADGLRDRDAVHVVGTGFGADGEVTLVECAATGDPQCADLGVGAYAPTDATGGFATDVKVRRLIQPRGAPVIDCARDAGCVVVARDSYTDDLETTAAIHFDPSVPPPPPASITVTPSTQLRDGQTVNLAGVGFDPGVYLFAAECLGADAANSDGCISIGPDGELQTDESGALSVDVSVHRLLPGVAPGSLVDCADAPCSVAVGTFDGFGAAIGAPVAFDASVPPPPAPAITVTPATDLVHGQRVHVTGRGFISGYMNLGECAGNTEDVCRWSRGDVVVADDGTFAADLAVARILHDSSTDTDVDCAVAACRMLAYGAYYTAVAPLEFRSGPVPPPLAVQVTPATTGLHDGQVIELHATHGFPGDELQVTECLTTAGGQRCRYFTSLTVGPDGTVAQSIAVHRRVPDFGCVGRCAPHTTATNALDCIDAGNSCALTIDDYQAGAHFAIGITFDPNAPLAPPPTITVSPNRPLRPGTQVQVQGSGFDPNEPVTVAQCLGADGSGACGRTVEATTDAAGHLDAALTVILRVQSAVNGGLCGECSIVVSRWYGIDDPAVVPIHFDPGAPSLGTILQLTPSAQLTDGTDLALHATGFDPGAQVAMIECAGGASGQNDCDLQTLVFARVGDDGALDQQFTVHSSIDVSSGTVDCTASLGRCSVDVADTDGFSTVAASPLYFGADAPTVRVPNARFTEGARSRLIAAPVRLSAPVGASVTIRYRLVGGSARAGNDFRSRLADVTIPPGATEAPLPFVLLADAIAEPTEQFRIEIVAAVGATVDNSHGVVTVVDDD